MVQPYGKGAATGRRGGIVVRVNKSREYWRKRGIQDNVGRRLFMTDIGAQFPI